MYILITIFNGNAQAFKLCSKTWVLSLCVNNFFAHYLHVKGNHNYHICSSAQSKAEASYKKVGCWSNIGPLKKRFFSWRCNFAEETSSREATHQSSTPETISWQGDDTNRGAGKMVSIRYTHLGQSKRMCRQGSVCCYWLWRNQRNVSTEFASLKQYWEGFYLRGVQV